MSEFNVPVDVVAVEYYCDEEGCEGNVTPDPDKKVAFMTDPIQFPHRCETCGKEYTFTDKYPKLSYFTRSDSRNR